MVDFTSTQLSWIVLGACSIGGTGYISMNDKIDALNNKITITTTVMDNNQKNMEQLHKQLERIEEKIDRRK